MNTFFKNKRELIAVSGWILFVAAIIYFVVMPLTVNINDTKDKIQEDILKQQIAGSHLGELPKMQQQYKLLENNISETDVLLDKANAVELIERLEGVATESNVKIVIAVQDVPKTTPAPPKDKSAADADILSQLPSQNMLRFSVKLNGTYTDIIKFISTIEHFEYYGDIIKLDIGNSSDQGTASKQSKSGILDPFSSSKNESTPIQAVEKNYQQANLDVVFYTK